MTVVDRPDNGQDEGRCLTCSGRFWSVRHGKWIQTRETVGMACQTCGTDYGQRNHTGRAGSAEQQRLVAVIEEALWQREQFTLDIPDEPGHRLAWAAGAGPFIRGLADELLALLGGPQPDGEAGRD